MNRSAAVSAGENRIKSGVEEYRGHDETTELDRGGGGDVPLVGDFWARRKDSVDECEMLSVSEVSDLVGDLANKLADLHIGGPDEEQGPTIEDVPLVSARQLARDMAINIFDEDLSSAESIPPLASEGSTDEDAMYGKLSAAEIASFTDETWGFGGVDYYVRQDLAPKKEPPSEMPNIVQEEESRPFIRRRNISQYKQKLMKLNIRQVSSSGSSESEGSEFPEHADPMRSTPASRFRGEHRQGKKLKKKVKNLDNKTSFSVATQTQPDETPAGPICLEHQKVLTTLKPKTRQDGGFREPGTLDQATEAPFTISFGAVFFVLFTGVVVILGSILAQKFYTPR